MRRIVTLGVGAAALLAASTARAQVVDPQDYPVERLRLAMDGDGVLDTEAGSVPSGGSWNLGLRLAFADDPLVAYRSGDGEGGARTGALVDNRLGASLAFAYSLRGVVELGLEVPLILYQDRDDMVSGSGMLGALSATGIGDLRLAPKLRLLHGAVDLAVVAALTLPTGGHDSYFGDRSVTFAPELALSRTSGGLRVAADLGYRARKNSADLDLTVEDEITLRGGVGYRAGKLDVAGGLSGALPASAPIGNGNANALELLAEIGVHLGAIHVFVGGGIGVESGYGVPDGRVFVGTRYSRSRPRPEPRPVVPDPPPVVEKPDPDRDHDTFANEVDACPDQPETVNGFSDEDGCPDAVPDTDGDGFTDDKDGCKDLPEDVDGFGDDDGCPDEDNDADGVLDVSDGCPEVAGPVENQGCPDADRDGDTVVDRLDNCPDEPGTVKNQGCKDKQLVVIGGDRLQILDRVMFREDKAVLQRSSYKLLRNLAAVINAHPQIATIEIAGYTSSDGNDAHNLDLSQRRADSVKWFLVDLGVDPARLIPKGYGEADPVADNRRRKGRDANRRVEFRIVTAPAAEVPSDSN